MDVLHSCYKAYDAEKAQIGVRDKELSQAEVLLKSKDSEIEDLTSKSNSLFRSPWLYFTVGILAGVFVEKKL